MGSAKVTVSPGPLAQQFAQVRDWSEGMALMLIDLGDDWAHENHAGICDLTREIERHVQEMEQCLRNVIPIADSHLMLSHKDERLIQRARAALPAREEGDPTNE